MSWIEQYVQPGMTVLDIGANHGSITNQLVQAVGETGVVWAIEPHSDLAPELRRYTPHVLSLAAGDRDGMTTLYLSRQYEHNSLYAANLNEATGDSMAVRIAQLDTLQRCGELPTPIDAIKIDAQGAEAAIVRGAQRLLREQRPVVYFELWPVGLRTAGGDAAGLCAAFEALDYRPDGRTWADVLTDAENCRAFGSSIDVCCLSDEGVIDVVDGESNLDDC